MTDLVPVKQAIYDGVDRLLNNYRDNASDHEEIKRVRSEGVTVATKEDGRDIEYLIYGEQPTFINTPGAGQDKVGYKRVFYKNVTDGTDPKELYIYQLEPLVSERTSRR